MACPLKCKFSQSPLGKGKLHMSGAVEREGAFEANVTVLNRKPKELKLLNFLLVGSYRYLKEFKYASLKTSSGMQ